jgi:hypothetical protein
MPCPSLITLIIYGEVYNHDTPHYAVFCGLLSLHLKPKYLPQHPILYMGDQVSHPYKTSKIMYFNISIFTFLDHLQASSG